MELVDNTQYSITTTDIFLFDHHIINISTCIPQAIIFYICLFQTLGPYKSMNVHNI